MLLGRSSEARGTCAEFWKFFLGYVGEVLVAVGSLFWNFLGLAWGLLGRLEGTSSTVVLWAGSRNFWMDEDSYLEVE